MTFFGAAVPWVGKLSKDSGTYMTGAHKVCYKLKQFAWLWKWKSNYVNVTVVCIRESTKPSLCSKLTLFKTFWQMLEVMLQLSPLTWVLPNLKAFQWGNVWPCISMGSKKTFQSWNVQIYFIKVEFSTLNCHISNIPWGTGSKSTSLESS